MHFIQDLFIWSQYIFENHLLVISILIFFYQASTVANASSHMKSSRPDRVEPPSSHARVPHPPVPPYGQPMIALSTPSSHHGPPMGIPQQLPPGPHGMPPGQPMMNGPYGMPMGPGQHSSQHGPSPPVQSQHGPPGQRGLPGQHSIHGQSQGIKRPPPTSHGGPPAHHMRFAPGRLAVYVFCLSNVTIFFLFSFLRTASDDIDKYFRNVSVIDRSD